MANGINCRCGGFLCVRKKVVAIQLTPVQAKLEWGPAWDFTRLREEPGDYEGFDEEIVCDKCGQVSPHYRYNRETHKVERSQL